MDFLAIREEYKLAYRRWENCANKLCEMLGTNFANLEAALIYASPHQPLVAEYARLGLELDQASDRWDTAQAVQAKILVDRDLKALDC